MATTSIGIEAMRGVLQATITDILSNEVAESIKEIEAKKVEEQVYGVYSPSIYKRRGGGGGLADVANMITYVDNMEIAIVNETPFNHAYDFKSPSFIPPPNSGNDGLAILVEGGQGAGGYIYNYPYHDEFLAPRPFTHETIEALKKGALKKMFVQAFKRRGIVAK